MRHTGLIPYSREHHEALLIVLRLKKGGPASPHDTLWPTDILQQRHFLTLFAEGELYKHFSREEETLFPVAECVSDELAALVERLRAEHNQMRSMLSELVIVNDTVTLKTRMLDFALVLEQHVRTEERELFPAMEQAETDGLIVIPEG